MVGRVCGLVLQASPKATSNKRPRGGHGSSYDVGQEVALQPDDQILQRELLFFQPLHLDLIGEIIPRQLIDARVKRPVGGPQLTQFTFDPG